MIRFAAVPESFAPIAEELEATVRSILATGQMVQGAQVRAFEEAFAEYCGVEHAVAVSSGTDALVVALRALGVGPGDEIITTPLTFFATTEAILLCGAKPVFVDVDDRSLQIDAERVGAAVTPRTVGILPVHLYGAPADLVRLGEVADEHGLWLVEDAAQAHGARLHGRRVGSFGRGACFSFYPGKNLGTCGEGGAVVTSDPAYAQELRLLRDHGAYEKYEHVRVGLNARMSEIEAAALRLKLPHLDAWNERRRGIADVYRLGLGGAGVQLVEPIDGAECVHHLFTVRCDDRDALREHLAARDIQSGLHYPRPVHLQRALGGDRGRPGDFPVAEAAAARTLSLPMHPELGAGEVREVCAAVRDWSALRSSPVPQADALAS